MSATQIDLFEGHRAVDPTEAPDGHFAVSKESVDREIGNLCRACDWRPTCQRPDTDFTVPGHRCMSYAIVTPDGRELRRNDGCSVVFRRKL